MSASTVAFTRRSVPSPGPNRRARGAASRRSICGLRHVRPGEPLYRAGEACSAFYVVRLGLFKSLTSTEQGQAQITGFHDAGDIMGLDGVDGEHYQLDVVALDAADVFVLPFAAWRSWWREAPHARAMLMRLLGQEIARSHALMLLLGTAPARRRVAAFLLDMSARHARSGCSRTRFTLKMTRYDIASYLGLSHECVSRMLSQMHQEGLVHVQGRAIALLDFPALRELAGTYWTDERRTPVRIVDRRGALLLDGGGPDATR